MSDVSLPTRPGVLTEQVNLLRQLERAGVTFLKEYYELPERGYGAIRLRNKTGGEFQHYRWDEAKSVWARISEEEFELELERRLAKFMEAQRLGPYAGGK